MLIITVLIIVSNLLLGLIAFSKNPKSATNRSFLLLAAILSLWAGTNYGSVRPGLTYDETLFWIRAVMVVTGAMFPTLYLLAKAFPEKTIGLSRGLLMLIVLFTISTQVLAATPLVFQKIIVSGTTVTPVPGPGMAIFAANVLLFLSLTLVTLFKKWREFKGRQKIQLNYLILGIVLTFTLATLTNFLLVNLFHNSSLVALGPAFTLIMVGFIAYTIVRHNFLDIRLVMARSVTYVLLISGLAIFYAFGLFASAELFTKTTSSGASLAVSTVLALVMAITFQPLKRLLERVTNRIFYRDRYDTDELLLTMSRVMASALTLKVLSQNILAVLRQQMHILKAGMLVLDKEGKPIQEVAPEDQPPYDLSSEDIGRLQTAGEILIFDELPEGDTKEMLRQHDISVFLPLRTTHRLVGYLIISSKTSGEIYFEQDIKALAILAPELAVTAENALAYEEIRQFNATLQSEVEKATEDLRRANERLQEFDKLKDEFISIASHDLRTPIATVKNFLWLTLNGQEPLSEKTKDNLQRSYDAAERTAVLVSDMLDVSRIEAGRIEVKIEPLELAKIIGEVKDDMTTNAVTKEINLTIDEPAPQTKVMADHERLLQVINNLLSNAIKFTPNGGKVSLNIHSEDNKVIIYVSDSGIGIDQKDFPKLFTKFGRLHNTLSSVPEAPGTGLGLYITKKLVELMGGNITVTSEVAKGTTFTFNLKCA